MMGKRDIAIAKEIARRWLKKDDHSLFHITKRSNAAINAGIAKKAKENQKMRAESWRLAQIRYIRES